jgi:hypothetical protein
MTLKEWRKKQGISHYTFGTMLGIKSINPATNSQRYCLESIQKSKNLLARSNFKSRMDVFKKST